MRVFIKKLVSKIDFSDMGRAAGTLWGHGLAQIAGELSRQLKKDLSGDLAVSGGMVDFIRRLVHFNHNLNYLPWELPR
jgi:hypothetical protein